MTEYFVPKTQRVKLPNGATHQLVRGVHEVPDAIVDSQMGIDLGIKTIDEMTDAEWRSVGGKPELEEPETQTDNGPKPALDGAVRRPAAADPAA